MAILKTPAIVLKCDNYRETSKIVTLFTLTHGKIRCIAKGVRKTNTNWGGNLQTMSYLNILFYYKENRSLNLLSAADNVEIFKGISNEHEKLNIAYRIVELVNKTTLDYHENQGIFRLLCETLRNLDNATKNYENLLFKFEFLLASLLGFEINFRNKTVYYGINSYNVIENKKEIIYNKNYRIRYSNETLRDSQMSYTENEKQFFDLLKNGNFADVMEYNILKTSSKKIDNYLESHFREHIENIGILKTKKVINS